MSAPDAGRGRPSTWVLGVDSGGSGLRVALAGLDGEGAPVVRERVVCAEPVRTGPAGIDAAHLAGQVVPAARAMVERAGGGRIEAVCVGAAGMASLGGQLRSRLPGVLADELGARSVALAADAVTGYAGALGERPGVVVALGTGAMALGTDLRSWRRSDGWGHLLGDCGGGAWIGRAGLEAALRAHDGREGGSTALLARATRVFGPMPGLPERVYPRADRPAVLASFAPEVAGCAAGRTPDPVAVGILRRAAEEVAVTAAAARPAGGEVAVALTGGLLGLGEPLLAPLREQLVRRLPDARLQPAAGGPLEGAVLVAARLYAGTLRLPVASPLLHVV